MGFIGFFVKLIFIVSTLSVGSGWQLSRTAVLTLWAFGCSRSTKSLLVAQQLDCACRRCAECVPLLHVPLLASLGLTLSAFFAGSEFL